MKKTEEKKCCCEPKKTKNSKEDNMVMGEIHKIGDEVMEMVNKAKSKYEKADDKTKKALIAGVAGAAAIIAGVVGYKKMKGKK